MVEVFIVNDKVIKCLRKITGGEVTSVSEITLGISGAKTYKAIIDGKEWMVKFIPFAPIKLWWYKQLEKRSNTFMANPKIVKRVGDFLCLLSPFINGENLETHLSNLSNEEVQALGEKAGEIVYSLHKTKLFILNAPYRLRKRVERVIKKVNDYGLTFPHKNECVQFIKSNYKKYRALSISVTHADLRPENFIVKDNDLFLIDFENGGVGDAVSDFFNSTTMDAPRHRAFHKALVNKYLCLSDINKEEFWEANLFYSTLAVLEYAVWKWEAKRRQVKLQAENLFSQYEGFTKKIPKWWKDF